MRMGSPVLPARPPVGSVYPDLPRPDGPAPDNPHAFRLWEVSRVRESLEEEARRHGATRRRYKRAANALIYTGIATNTAAAGCGGAAVATLTAGITAPASLVLGAVALGAGGVSTACSVAGKLLGKRIAKHERISTAARTRLDTVSAVVSKALSDQNISHDEYAAVLQQAEQYRRQKAEFRADSRPSGSGALEKAKNGLRAQVRDDLLKQLRGSSASR